MIHIKIALQSFVSSEHFTKEKVRKNMNKTERIERKDKVFMIRRNHSALKAAKIATNINKFDTDTFNTKLAACKNQAQVIHLCIENAQTSSFIADALVKMQLCKDDKAAYARIKRHKNHDESSRIVSRSLALTV